MSDLKDIIKEFDDTTAQHNEETEKALDVNQDKQEGEAKSEGTFIEQPKDEKADESDDVKSEEKEVEAKEVEDSKEEAVEVEKPAEDSKDDSKEEVEKSEKSDEKQEDKKDKKDSSKKGKKKADKEEDDNKEDKKEDKVEKSVEDEEQTEAVSADNSELVDVLKTISKSYRESLENQRELSKTIASLEEQVTSLNTQLVQKSVDEEEDVAKSILSDESDKEGKVEDKAVSYVSKNVAGLEEQPVQGAEDSVSVEIEGSKQDEPAEAFVYDRDRQPFLNKLKKDIKNENLSRGKVTELREAQYRASSGQATDKDLDLLHNYISE